MYVNSYPISIHYKCNEFVYFEIMLIYIAIECMSIRIPFQYIMKCKKIKYFEKFNLNMLQWK